MKLSDDLLVFSKSFKKRRKEMGWKRQDQIADELEKNEYTIRNWEQGRNIPEIKDLLNICDKLNCSLDYLFGRIECTTHNIQFISDETHLTEQSIKHLANNKSYSEVINCITNSTFAYGDCNLHSAILKYLYMDENPKEEALQMYEIQQLLNHLKQEMKKENKKAYKPLF